ncbi:MAG: hypothetical protein DSZ28_08105 [Thiothrix sp.]|nr:MAG: hypothetical protein DSZ28_08105 [Thiothrix sp.]
MFQLSKGLDAWQTPVFNKVMKDEIECLDAGQLPLQQGLIHGSYAIGENFKVMIIGVSEVRDALRVRAGVFYKSVIAGCSCADDPTPINECAEYCELEFEIDRETANARVSLFSES